MAIENSAVLKLVARLVMDYLDEQDLTDAYNTFCETSRHLSDQEYLAYSQGIKTLDNGYGLINIVTEYFLIKDKLRDFIRSCPKTSIIISLIDTANIQSRLEIILKVLKDNLLKFDQVQEDISRKRRKTENELFDVSQTNTSTPETVHPSKKRRILCTNSPNTSINDKKVEEKEVTLGSKDLNYISSPETSNKEDDVTDDDTSLKPTTSNAKIAPPPELLSETILKKPDFAENLAEIINKTLAEREEHEKSTEATNSQNLLTKHDVQDILSKTENDFEDILKEVIDKYLIDGTENGKVDHNDSHTNLMTESKNEEIPIKQRLRPRVLKKIPSTERKKKKINIISNELYTGPLPLCVKRSATTPTIISPVEPITTSVTSVETHTSQPLILVPIMQSLPSSTFIPLQSFQSAGNIICESNVPITTTAELPSNVQIIFTENNPPMQNLMQNNNDEKEPEKVQKTPKRTIQTNFLESKCKSTPRRKATHVRILDFTHTPSARLAAIKECKTPSNSSIRLDTPGSAPASIMVSQKVKVDTETTKIVENVENGDKSIEIIDESSNSNSISNTPKVAKNRRRRKIEIDSKFDKTHEELSPKPMTHEDWIKMREQQKSLSVDERMRILFQQNEEKNNPKKRKTPKKKKEDCKKSVKKIKPLNTSVQHGKGKLCAKFKVTSPRKAALLRKTPKKKKLLSGNVLNQMLTESSKENKENNIEIQKDEPKVEKEQQQQLSVPKIMSNESLVDDKKEENFSNDLNRSDTVQEVANLLTHLPETILAKTNSGNSSFEQTGQKTTLIDASILMETPLKVDSISPLPNTPRFAVPLISTHQETPIAKEVIAITTAPSILKVCDILTPSFPITPGFKVTPAKSEASPGTGYSSRKTDYSSCSSYYKPDESEDINLNLDNIIKQSRSSQSESDGGNLVAPIIIIEKKEKIRTGSVKKVECPGAIERVLSFTEETETIVIPHYNMNEEGLLSESMITTCSDESSSSFTCSTCSTDPSSDENTIEKLNKALNTDDRDSEWLCEDEIDIKSNTSLVDEKTGEVRFPLRSWITPKKVDPEETTKLIIDEMKNEKLLTTICTDLNVKSAEERKEEERKQAKANIEAIKQRTINIIKKESAINARKDPPKFKKANVKQFKLPAEQPKVLPLTRREQILQHTLTERPKSTPLKLIPSTSSSRRKCLTPRKTIIMDELPKADPTVRKVSTTKKRQSNDKAKPDSVKIIKSPVKPEKVSLENINDNAMMHDDHPSLNISTSFHESSDEEPENTVVDKTVQKATEEGSNTFQRTLIAQGFEKTEAKDLQMKFVDKIEEEQQKAAVSTIEVLSEQPKISPETNNNNNENNENSKLEELNLSVPESESEEEEDECDFAFADILEKNIFTFEEPPNFVPKKEQQKIGTLCAPSKLQIDGRTVKIDFSNTMDIFSMEPVKKLDENVKKEQQKDILKPSEPKILAKEISIDKILTMIHGKH